jgi:hypothetical protein
MPPGGRVCAIGAWASVPSPALRQAMRRGRLLDLDAGGVELGHGQRAVLARRHAEAGEGDRRQASMDSVISLMIRHCLPSSESSNWYF